MSASTSSSPSLYVVMSSPPPKTIPLPVYRIGTKSTGSASPRPSSASPAAKRTPYTSPVASANVSILSTISSSSSSPFHTTSATSSMPISPSELAAVLRTTAKGRLKYDRGTAAGSGGPGQVHHAAATTTSSTSANTERASFRLHQRSPSPSSVSSPSSPSPSSSSSTSPSCPSPRPRPPVLTSQLSQASSFQSVLEEVAEELHAAKLNTIVQVSKMFQQSQTRSGKRDLDVTLGPKAASPTRVPVVEEEIVPVKAYVCGDGDGKKKVQFEDEKKKEAVIVTPPKKERLDPSMLDPGAVSLMASPSSPADEELHAMELRRVGELEARKREREIDTRRKLNALRADSDSRMKSRLDDLAREESDRVAAAEAEAERARVEEEAAKRSAKQEAAERSERVMAALLEAEKEEAKKKAQMERLLASLQEAAASASAAEGPEGTSSWAELKSAMEEAAAALQVSDNSRVGELTTRLQEAQLKVVRDSEELKARLKREEEERAKRAQEAEEAAARAKKAQEAQEEQKRRAEEQAAAAAAASAASAAALASKPEGPPGVGVHPAAASESSSALLHETVSARNLQRMEELAAHKAEWATQLAAIVQHAAADANLKTFKFSCQKAVSTPVNAISATSSAHLRDKLDKLRALLSGAEVDVGGGKRVAASQHPLGVPFCINLLAKKFVLQGEDVVSSKPDYAFSMGTVVANLWAEYPEFGRIFLAHLFEACPYLVPCHLQKAEGEADEAYYRRLGYRYDDGGKVEEQPKFVKRMGGLARLFAAVCTSHLAKQHSNKDHPHGVGHVWAWAASTMNLRPLNDVTATMLHDVLEVAGSALQEHYGKMFPRLLLALKDEYFSKIEAVTLEGSGGPVARLKEFLDKAVREGGIKKPKKELPQDFI